MSPNNILSNLASSDSSWRRREISSDEHDLGRCVHPDFPKQIARIPLAIEYEYTAGDLRRAVWEYRDQGRVCVRLDLQPIPQGRLRDFVTHKRTSGNPNHVNNMT